MLSSDFFSIRAVMRYLIAIHILLISLSNVLVQFPVKILGFYSTWGAMLYPMIFIVTDLTVRFCGQRMARKVVLQAMLPALIVSYLCACLSNSAHSSITVLTQFNELAFRIAAASFTAYVIGQLLDITVFQRLRQSRRWWFAPMGATLLGNLIDTWCFFFIAFYRCKVPELSNHWVEIALVDLSFKCSLGVFAFVPVYGMVLNYGHRRRQGCATRV